MRHALVRDHLRGPAKASQCGVWQGLPSCNFVSPSWLKPLTCRKGESSRRGGQSMKRRTSTIKRSSGSEIGPRKKQLEARAMRMRKWNQFIIVVAVAALLSSGTRAQDAPKGPVLSSSQAVLQNWNEIGRKLIAMAED